MKENEENDTFPKWEFGSVRTIRFLDTSQIRLHDEEGNVIFCCCGKPATTSLVGENFVKSMCSECMYGAEEL